MALPTQAQLVIDIGDKDKAGMYLGPDGAVGTQLGEIVRFDGVPGNFRFVTKSQDASRSWDDLNLAGATIEAAIGNADQSPTGGTWGLSYNGSSTGLTNLAFNIAAVDLQTAINANAAVQADAGGSTTAVTVTQFGSQYVVAWTVTGARFSLVSTASNLSPASVASVNVVTAGGTGVDSVQTISLVQLLYAYTNSFTSSAAGAITSSHIQVGAAGQKDIQRITFNVAAYGGTYTVNLGLAQITDITFQANTAHFLDTKYFLLQDNAGTVAVFMTDTSAVPSPSIANRIITVTLANNDSAATVLGKVSTAITGDPYGWTVTTPTSVILEVTDPTAGARPLIGSATSNFAVTSKQAGTSYSNTFAWNATAQQLDAAFTGYFNVKVSALGFTLTSVTDGAKSLVSIVTTDLLFPTFNSCTLDLNTFSTFLAFVSQANIDPINAVFEIKITLSGGKPLTVYRETIFVYRNVINVSTLAPAPLVPGVTGVNYRTNSAGYLQIKNTTTNLWHTLYVTGAAGAEQLAIVTPGVA